MSIDDIADTISESDGQGGHYHFRKCSSCGGRGGNWDGGIFGLFNNYHSCEYCNGEGLFVVGHTSALDAARLRALARLSESD